MIGRPDRSLNAVLLVLRPCVCSLAAVEAAFYLTKRRRLGHSRCRTRAPSW